MSVRKAPARAGIRSQTANWSAIKNAAIWIGAMAGCFTFGLLVVSPLLNMVSGSTHNQPAPLAQSTTPLPPAPQPQPQAAAAPKTDANRDEDHPRRRHRRDSDQPDINVSPDQSGDSVQKPGTPDQPAATTDEKKDDAQGDQKPSLADQITRDGARQDAESVDKQEDNKTDDTQKSDDERPRHKRHRRHHRDDGDRPSDGDKSTDGDTQRGDAVD